MRGSALRPHLRKHGTRRGGDALCPLYLSAQYRQTKTFKIRIKGTGSLCHRVTVMTDCRFFERFDQGVPEISVGIRCRKDSLLRILP